MCVQNNPSISKFTKLLFYLILFNGKKYIRTVYHDF